MIWPARQPTARSASHDSSVSPDTDSVEVNGVAVRKGCRVRLCPGARRADAQDMFLEGRVGMVEGVFLDVENRNYVAVTLEDPKVFTKPFTIRFSERLLPDTDVFEHICAEDEKDAAHTAKAAR